MADGEGIISVDLVEGLNGPYWLPRGKHVIGFKATSGDFDTAVVTVRTHQSMVAGDFTTDTAVKDPDDPTSALSVIANRGNLVIQGPTGIAINVATIGAAAGLQFLRSYAGQR